MRFKSIIFLSLSLTTMTGCKSDSKTFTSLNRHLSLTLPADWEEYNDGEESTSAFFNSKSWTGNFRVTPFHWRKPAGETEDQAAEFVQDELNDNPGASRFKIGEYDCAHYKKDIVQDGEQLVIYYWAFGWKNSLFICSFTIVKNQDNTTQNQTGLQTIQSIIASIKIG